MDIIINLLKQLATTLSPTEFLIAVIMIIMMTLSGIKFVLGILMKGGKGNILSSFLVGSNAGASDDVNKVVHEQIVHSIEKIERQISELATKDQLNSAQLAATDHRNHLGQIINNMQKQLDTMSSSIHQISIIRQDLENSFREFNEDLNELKTSSRDHDHRADKNHSAMRDHIQRTQDIMNRLMTQVEKVDEFTKSSVPEFRSYHKELFNELKSLSKDLAVIERTLHTQINTGGAVKLR